MRGTDAMMPYMSTSCPPVPELWVKVWVVSRECVECVEQRLDQLVVTCQLVSSCSTKGGPGGAAQHSDIVQITSTKHTVIQLSNTVTLVLHVLTQAELSLIYCLTYHNSPAVQHMFHITQHIRRTDQEVTSTKMPGCHTRDLMVTTQMSPALGSGCAAHLTTG
jgi:hypothetical protein